MAIKPPKKDKLSGYLAIAVFLAAGLLLLFRQDLMTELTRLIVSVVLGVYAVCQAVRYFRTPAEQAAAGYRLSLALIAGVVALLAFTNSGMLNNHLWGMLLVSAGFVKFQTSWDFYRLGHSRWWWFMVISAVSLCFGVLILTDAGIAGPVFIGVALVLEAVMDTAALLMVRFSDKLEAMAERGREKKAEKKAEAEKKAQEEAEAQKKAEEDAAARRAAEAEAAKAAAQDAAAPSEPPAEKEEPEAQA